MTQDNCTACKRVREHVASLLPFKILESIAGMPLRIGGVALAAGLSRNFNVYTPEELGDYRFLPCKLAGLGLQQQHNIHHKRHQWRMLKVGQETLSPT